MTRSTAATLARIFPEALESVLKLVEDLSDEQLRWRPTGTSNSLAWNLWHLARWADRAQNNLRLWSPGLRARFGSGGELWRDQRLAEAWGFTVEVLGWNQTGMEMEADVAYELAFPARETLLDYARASFDAVNAIVQSLDDEVLTTEYQSALDGARSTIESALITWMTHNDRHLGMMECLRGLLGLRGSATR
jgi:hypothetical protein